MCWDRNPLTITVIAADLCVQSGVASLGSSQSWHISRQTNSETYQFALHSVVSGLHTSCGPLLPLLRLSVRGGRGETWQLECRSPRNQCTLSCRAWSCTASRCRCIKMHTIRITRSLFRFQLLPVTNSNCGALMAWSEVASGSPWSSIEIEAQNCLFGCANHVLTDVIYIMHVFVGSTERQPRFIWGLEALAIF